MSVPLIALGFLIAYIWQVSLRQQRFIIQTSHPDKLLLGLGASLADKYQANIWVVRLLLLFVLNFGYFLMYILLPKTENQAPSRKSNGDSKDANFQSKS